MTGTGIKFLRAGSLVVGPASGNNALDLSRMHFVFNVTRATINTPQAATIRVYNLSNSTAKMVYALSPSATQPDGGQVLLKAGYAGITSGVPSGAVLTAQGQAGANVGTIFQGQIRNVVKGRENNTDTFVEILATDSDQAYNYGTVNATLSAGWTQQDVANQINAGLAPFGVTPGMNTQLGTTPAARGKVMFGMARNFGRKLALNNACSWQIYNGQTTTIANGGALPLGVQQINDATGMIGVPQITLNGIEVYSLLDPTIVPGSIIQLNNADIQGFQISPNYTALQFVPSTEADGFYRVYWLERQGDTRGNDWFNHMICTGATAPVPMTSAFLETID
jgi:hypothetical protein